ncbi:MAG TPA: ABC transporter substrate-binding protein [Pyrinomonadaceae bacterium]|nr:ABC transporter substrate-binding protein [Pyrinomonadaceae bacterium]
MRAPAARPSKQSPAGFIQVVLLAGAMLFLAFGFTVLAQDALTPQESRGKQIYVQGKGSSSREILAYLGESSIEVPGSAMPCANCHGLDGRGKPEGGVNPSNLVWDVLTKPYGPPNANGRKHPPYNERGLELAITRGTDPAGNKLLNVMPRYQMSREDLSDLVVYLKRLGNSRDPGISEDKIVIGTVVPLKGGLAEMGQAVKAATTAYFQELNSQGGIYNRRFELKFAETAESSAATRANVERFIKEEQIFAMTAAFIAGSEKEIIPLLAQQEVPLIGPLTLYPQTDFPLNREVFYLLSGIDGQAQAMIHFAAKKPEIRAQHFAVVFPQSELNLGVLGAIKDQSKKDELSAPQAFDYAAGHFDAAETIKQVRQTSSEVVVFLGGSEDALSFMTEADKSRWYPTIFLPSASGGKEIFGAPIGFNGKLFFSFPTAPADQSADGVKEFRALAEKYKLPTHHLAAQISAFSAAKILVEALKRVGKDLSREKLIQALEGLYEYQTGLTPAITYGPNRRIGAMGAYIVTVDLKEKQFLPASGWINLN